jgi:hypothetical protein
MKKFGRDDAFRLGHYFEIAAGLAIRMLADELLGVQGSALV